VQAYAQLLPLMHMQLLLLALRLILAKLEQEKDAPNATDCMLQHSSMSKHLPRLQLAQVHVQAVTHSLHLRAVHAPGVLCNQTRNRADQAVCTSKEFTA
jgi:hypothetical protein